MFNKKQWRERDKLILNDIAKNDGTNGDPAVIDVKISSREQLFSSFSYSGDKLNGEFSEFIFDRAKNAPLKDDLTIRLHTAENIEENEVRQALKRHFRAAYLKSKKQSKRLAQISAVMTALGVIALTVLILINYLFKNIYLTSIVEIAAWVFIWEAVDFFFLQRPVVKAESILIQRIYCASIEICKEGQPTVGTK